MPIPVANCDENGVVCAIVRDIIIKIQQLNIGYF